MKIAIDIRSLMEGRRSGIETYTREIIANLMEVAPQHEFHLFYNSLKTPSLPPLPAKAQVHAFMFPNKVFNASQLALRYPAWDQLVKADIFFVPHIRLCPLASNVPLVVTAHDLSFERFPEVFSRERQIWHRLMKPRDLMRRANTIIAVSKSTAIDITELYHIPEERVVSIHSGISKVKQGDLSVSKRLPEKFLLFLGTIEPRKNVASVVAAFDAVASHIPHSLVLAGAPGWLTKEVEVAVKTSRYRERIHWLGAVNETEKQVLYQRASVLIYPSLYEGFGFPPLEALLSGTPVIVSHGSSFPETVGEYGYMIDPYSPAELAAVILQLIQYPITITEKDKQHIRDTFSWRRCARRTIAVLEKAHESAHA